VAGKIVPQIERAEIGQADLQMVALRLLIRQRKQPQRFALAGCRRMPAALDGCQFGWLIVAGIFTVQIAQNDLQRHGKQQKGQRTVEHQA